MNLALPIKEKLSLKSYNTFNFDAIGEQVAFIQNNGHLISIIKKAKQANWPLLILGGGSNVILKSKITGLVIIMRNSQIEVVRDDNNCAYVEAESGVIWDDFVKYTLSQGYYGLENLSLIPGTIGASPIQNIGAYGVEVKDFIHELTALEINTMEFIKFKGSECKFGYRDSIFKSELKGQYIISAVTFKLSKIPQIKINNKNLQKMLDEHNSTEVTPDLIRNCVIKLRGERLPDVSELGNVGSFYVNPVISQDKLAEILTTYPDIVYYPQENNQVKISAGNLISKCGLAGFKNLDKGVGIYKNNPLVLINYGTGTAADILELSIMIIDRVFEKFGIQLKMEPTIYGGP